MNELMKQILESFQLPEMTTSKVPVTIDTEILHSHVSRRRISLPAEDVRELCDYPDAWLYPTDISGVLGNLPANHPGTTGSVAFAEYIGGIEKFYPYVPGVRTAIGAGVPIDLTVYSANQLVDKARRPTPITKHIGDELKSAIDMKIGSDHNEGVPVFEFQKPEMVVMTSFVAPKYDYAVTARCFMERCNILATNLPYDYYHYQPLELSAYTLDEDDGKFRFCGMDEDAFLPMLYGVYNRGITEPIIFTISGEVLIPYGTESTINLFIAKLLKLPTIPALIVASNDTSVHNFFMEGVMNAKPNMREMVKTSLQHIRHMLMPYIAIIDHAEMDTSLPTFNVNGTAYQKALYRKFTNHGETDVYCLATDVDSAMMTSSEEKVQQAQKELADKASARMNDRVTRIRAKLEKLGKDG